MENYEFRFLYLMLWPTKTNRPISQICVNDGTKGTEFIISKINICHRICAYILLFALQILFPLEGCCFTHTFPKRRLIASRRYHKPSQQPQQSTNHGLVVHLCQFCFFANICPPHLSSGSNMQGGESCTT